MFYLVDEIKKESYISYILFHFLLPFFIVLKLLLRVLILGVNCVCDVWTNHSLLTLKKTIQQVDFKVPKKNKSIICHLFSFSVTSSGPPQFSDSKSHMGELQPTSILIIIQNSVTKFSSSLYDDLISLHTDYSHFHGLNKQKHFYKDQGLIKTLTS